MKNNNIRWNIIIIIIITLSVAREFYCRTHVLEFVANRH